MQKALNDIEKLRKQLQSLQPMKPEYQKKLDKKFRLEFNYNSNHLEGNTLTYGETELLLIFGETKGTHDKREYDEMEAHDVAYERITEWANDKEMPLTEMAIKNLNEIILVKPFWKDAITPDGQATRRMIKIGDYKEFPNSVRLPNGQIFDYASPAETPILMGELIEWYRTEEEKKELHPVALAALLHYKFVRIHPFDDGNGRISRLLVNYVLLKNDLPPVIIKSAKKTEYLHALHQADAGYIDEFIDYIAAQEQWSLEISIKAAKGEDIDEPGDLDKKLKQLKKRLNFNEEIKVERNTEAIAKSFEGYIFSLIDQIESRLNSFKNLFKAQSATLVFHRGKVVVASTSASNFDEIRAKIISIPNVNEITYNYKLRAFRQETTKDINVEINFSILFHQLVYDIIFHDINLTINKVYEEEGNGIEENEIAEALGNYLFEKIEATLHP